jgi:hypothetical protein
MNNWPQYLILSLQVFSLGINMALWIAQVPMKETGTRGSLTASFIIGALALVFVLWRGGFFAPIGWGP